jgi:hypothetical protein
MFASPPFAEAGFGISRVLGSAAPHDTPRIGTVADQLALPNRVAPRVDRDGMANASLRSQSARLNTALMFSLASCRYGRTARSPVESRAGNKRICHLCVRRPRPAQAGASREGKSSPHTAASRACRVCRWPRLRFRPSGASPRYSCRAASISPSLGFDRSGGLVRPLTKQRLA